MVFKIVNTICGLQTMLAAASKLSSDFETGEVYIIYFLGWTTKGVHCTEGVEVIAKVN